MESILVETFRQELNWCLCDLKKVKCSASVEIKHKERYAKHRRIVRVSSASNTAEQSLPDRHARVKELEAIIGPLEANNLSYYL